MHAYLIVALSAIFSMLVNLVEPLKHFSINYCINTNLHTMVSWNWISCFRRPVTSARNVNTFLRNISLYTTQYTIRTTWVLLKNGMKDAIDFCKGLQLNAVKNFFDVAFRDRCVFSNFPKLTAVYKLQGLIAHVLGW